jgi:hypothetical protein
MKNKILLCTIIISLLLLNCYLSQEKINRFDNHFKDVKISSINVNGETLTDPDIDIIKKNIFFNIEGLGFFVKKDNEEYDYSFDIKLDSRPIGYELAFMKEMYSCFIEIVVKDNDGNDFIHFISNNKIYFSPREIYSLEPVIKNNLKSLKKEIIEKEKLLNKPEK